MKYDIVKDKIAFLISLIPMLRKIFYKVLNCLILRQQYVFKLIKEIYPDKQSKFKMYDAGGGYLQYTDYVLTNYANAEVFAVDIKDDYIDEYSHYIKNNKKNARFDHHCADLQTYTPNGDFDLIIAIDIMEHIENDRAVLNNFNKVLNDSGKLIISTPSTFDEAAAFTEEHVRPGYDKEDLIEKLLTAGFNIDKFKYTYGKYGAKYWKLAMKTPLSLLQINKLFFLFLPVYYLFTYPIISVLMRLDQKRENRIGNGILIVASKQGEK
jgi:2-polyprenyl-3-methyl-5-hydroxy-6-metoxy-1,4-benzoquinol methylase